MQQTIWVECRGDGRGDTDGIKNSILVSGLFVNPRVIVNALQFDITEIYSYNML